MSNHQQQLLNPSPIFRLPHDVRCLIWGELLSGNGDIVDVQPRDPFATVHPVYTSVLRTSRAIYDEAIPILYGNVVHRISDPMGDVTRRFIFPRLLVEDLVQHLQIYVRSMDNPMDTTWKSGLSGYLRRLATKPHKQSMEIAFATDVLSYEPYPLCSDITATFITDVKRLTNFQKVVIRLPYTRDNGKLALFWSSRLTRELETSLGPNISSIEHVLEFRPGNLAPSWVSKHVPGLMRLSPSTRCLIFLKVLHIDRVIYPPDNPLFQEHEAVERPSYKRTNPKLDLSLLGTSRKIWEEAKLALYLSNKFVFDFDFSKANLRLQQIPQEHIGLLSDVQVSIRNIKDSTDLYKGNRQLQRFLFQLTTPPKTTNYGYQVPRHRLCLVVGIDGPRWEFNQPPRSRPRFRHSRATNGTFIESESANELHFEARDAGAVANQDRSVIYPLPYEPFDNYDCVYNYDSVFDVHDYIWGRVGHDIRLAQAFKNFWQWDYVKIKFEPGTTENYYWRPCVTRFLEEFLGPNMSNVKTTLKFRPEYFHHLFRMPRMTREIARAMMLRKGSLSGEPSQDFEDLKDWNWRSLPAKKLAVDALKMTEWSQIEGEKVDNSMAETEEQAMRAAQGLHITGRYFIPTCSGALAPSPPLLPLQPVVPSQPVAPSEPLVLSLPIFHTRPMTPSLSKAPSQFGKTE